MKVLVLIELEDEMDERCNDRVRQRLETEIRGSLEYAACFSVLRIDVAGVDGVTAQGIISDVFPSGLNFRRRPGVENDCGWMACVLCYEPIP